MKTREELLAFADECIEKGRKRADSTAMLAYSNLAQACVMLAKELREGEKTASMYVPSTRDYDDGIVGDSD